MTNIDATRQFIWT